MNIIHHKYYIKNRCINLSLIII